MSSKIKIGYISDEPPTDINAWSGLNYFIANSLIEDGFELIPMHGWKRQLSSSAILWKLWFKLRRGGFYSEARNPKVLKNYAAQMGRCINACELDAVFSPGTALTASLDVKVPWFVWTDATVPCLFKLYPGYDRWSKKSSHEALQSELGAAQRATALIYSSKWAADSAVADLGADPTKVHVVPFGANLTEPPDRAGALAAAAKRTDKKIILLFAGVQWARKGGEKALAVAKAMADRSIVPVELRILGLTDQPIAEEMRANVAWLGRISKDTPEGMRRIEAEFAQAHYLLLPTVADCTPIVFAEASAYALPVVTHEVGGTACQIVHGENGGLFSLSTSAGEMAEWMFQHWKEPLSYRGLCAGARDMFDGRLNWKTAGKTAGAIIRAAIGK